MSCSLRTFVTISALVLTVTEGMAGIVLNGVAVMNDQPAFSLYSEEDKTNAWVFLGQAFAGFTAASFDPQTEVLSLEKNQVRTELRLQGSAIKPPDPAEAKARIQGLHGLNLAYELARQGNADLAKSLVEYHRVISRLQEAIAVSDSNRRPQSRADADISVAFLKGRATELRIQIGQAAEAAAAILLAAPVKK